MYPVFQHFSKLLKCLKERDERKDYLGIHAHSWCILSCWGLPVQLHLRHLFKMFPVEIYTLLKQFQWRECCKLRFISGNSLLTSISYFFQPSTADMPWTHIGDTRCLEILILQKHKLSCCVTKMHKEKIMSSCC